MRRPTSQADLYAWYDRRVVHGIKAAPDREAVTTQPQCGWFKVPLVKGGTPVPARIWCEQPVDEAGELTGPEVFRCEIDGEPRDAEEQWPWLCRHPITLTEFEYLTKLRRWLRVNAPAEYAAARSPVDHLSTPVLEE